MPLGKDERGMQMSISSARYPLLAISLSATSFLFFLHRF